MIHQSVISQKGEIEFRKNLLRQQIDGECLFNDEFDSKGIEKILIDRMKKTSNQMHQLHQIGVDFYSYLEIGAERCQRSLVMENEFNANGAAADISFDMLKSCDYYKNVYNKNRVPLRVCCDANHLPFMSNSVPFVYCYETLHHFPDPTPIVEEIHRVLSPGGHFFFDEEPYKRILHINLYKSKKIYSLESLGSSNLNKIFDYFFSRRNCNEIEYGIIENDEISLRVWKQALSSFKEKKVKLRFLRNKDSELFNRKHFIKNIIAYFFGGGISGICRKSGVSLKQIMPIKDVIICPSCIESGQESKLFQKQHYFTCINCSEMFPIIDNVVFLFSVKKLKVLYPEVYEQIRNTV